MCKNKKSVIYNFGTARASPTLLPAGWRAMRNVPPHYGARSCKQISRAKASRLFAALATSETWRTTSVIHNQLTEIIGLCLFGVERRGGGIYSHPRGQEKMNRLWKKQRQGRNKQTHPEWKLISSPLNSPKQPKSKVTFRRCLISHRWRHSERIKRWNTDTLATGGLHLDISRWVRPLDLHCFPMEKSQWFSEVPGLILDQNFCLL